MGMAGAVLEASATDEQLVATTRRGDDRAFEELYGRYQRRISAYVRGMVKDHGRSEDITQEIFVSALRRMRATERPIAFKPWVYEIARNACIDAFRRTRRAEEVSFDAEDGGAVAREAGLVSGTTPDAAMDAKQQIDDLMGALGGLSDSHHDILVMRELEGLSYREIGERLGLSRPSVESTLFRARKRLSEEYEELVSGERCVRVTELLAAGPDSLGARDRGRLARHVAHCQPCRREAYAAGVDTATLTRHRRRGSRRPPGRRAVPDPRVPALVAGDVARHRARRGLGQGACRCRRPRRRRGRHGRPQRRHDGAAAGRSRRAGAHPVHPAPSPHRRRPGGATAQRGRIPHRRQPQGHPLRSHVGSRAAAGRIEAPHLQRSGHAGGPGGARQRRLPALGLRGQAVGLGHGGRWRCHRARPRRRPRRSPWSRRRPTR